MFQYRDHRGGLSDSMATVQQFQTKAELIDYLQQDLYQFFPGKYDVSKIEIKYYGYDQRIGWDSYIVLLPSFGVLGFTDREVK